MKLVSMVDYVLERNDQKLPGGIYKHITDAFDFSSQVIKYARFLKQPLTLGMFVPCDEDGNVLEDPESTMKQGNGNVYYNAEPEDFEEYEKAEQRCLFKGFEYVSKWYQTHLIARNKITGNGQFQLDNFKTIEDVIGVFEIELTPTALKQIGI